MIKTLDKANGNFLIKAVYEEDKLDELVIKKNGEITEFLDKKEAVIFMGKKAEGKKDAFKATAIKFASLKRDFEVDVQSFVAGELSEEFIVEKLVEQYKMINDEIYNAKTKKENNEKELALIVTEKGKKAFEKAFILEEARTWARNFQVMPPNVLNSEVYADMVEKEFKKFDNLKVTVLNQKQIEDLKMGLLLSVNKGSKYEARVVIAEYTGNPESKEKTVVVGKGIVFDAGGYNIKTGKHMAEMKYDMSGSASAAGVMKAVAQLKPKSNFSIILVITDNMISPDASTPDAVWTSMNGKTVEINNTDAEGRLALADGITYAVRNLNATRIIDIATLTGAVLVALGNTFTGVWATNENDWTAVQNAANKADELVWRLPFHEDFFKFMKGSKVADLKNTDLTGMGGSSSAAMFLKSFAEGKDYVHMDIAGSSNVKDTPTGVMVKTLFEIANG